MSAQLIPVLQLPSWSHSFPTHYVNDFPDQNLLIWLSQLMILPFQKISETLLLHSGITLILVSIK